MSKKPSIYGYCPAGCKWETVHRDDFIAAATFVKVGTDDLLSFNELEVGKQYKIFAGFIDDDYTKGFKCDLYFKYTADTTETVYVINIPNEDKYADSFVFKFLDAIVGEEVVSGETRKLTIVYEISGVRYTEDLIVSTDVSVDTDNCLSVRNYGKGIYLYNDYANYTITGEKGDAALYCTNIYESSLDPDEFLEMQDYIEVPNYCVSRVPQGEQVHLYWLNVSTQDLFLIEAPTYLAGSDDYFYINQLTEIIKLNVGKPRGTGLITLTAAAWDSTANTQTISVTIDTANRNEIDVDPASIEEWANCGVIATSESSTDITFKCKTIPTNDLIFRVISSEVNYVS